MTDLDRLLTEENEYKPNRYVARTSFLLFVVLLAAYLANVVGFFHVDSLIMNLLLGVSLILGGIIIFFGYYERTATKKTTKYVITILILLETLCIMVALAQWVAVVLIIPMLLASQYHNDKVSAMTLFGTCFVAVASPPLSLMLGTWNLEYYKQLLRATGVNVVTFPLEGYVKADYYWMTIKYAALPRLALVLAVSTIMFSIARTGRENIENRIQAIRLSEVDILTGLYNRISYEKRLEELRENTPERIICIYADADNLHNLNNTQGHGVGDKMLIRCAELLKENFGVTYRVGGDEFQTFITEEPIELIEEMIQEINEVLARDNYHMSVGVSSGNASCNIDQLIREAEQAMFDAKRKYYQESGRDRRRR